MDYRRAVTGANAWTFLRVLVACIGVGALGGALFLYEDEERRLNNRLEDWWLALTDAGSRAKRKHGAMAISLANLVSRALSAVFGQKLLSLHVVLVSSMMSCAGYCLAFSALVSGRDMKTRLYIALFGAASLYAGVAFRATTEWQRKLGGGFFLVLAVVGAARFLVSHDFQDFFLAFLLLSTCISLIATRFLLGTVATLESHQLSLLALLYAADFAVCALVVGLPYLAYCRLMEIPIGSPSAFVDAGLMTLTTGSHDIGSTPLTWRTVAEAFSIRSDSLGSDKGLLIMMLGSPAVLAPTVLYVTLVPTLIVNQLVWPVVQRPVYALARFNVFQFRKTIATLGLLVILAAWLGDPCLLPRHWAGEWAHTLCRGLTR